MEGETVVAVAVNGRLAVQAEAGPLDGQELRVEPGYHFVIALLVNGRAAGLIEEGVTYLQAVLAPDTAAGQVVARRVQAPEVSLAKTLLMAPCLHHHRQTARLALTHQTPRPLAACAAGRPSASKKVTSTRPLTRSSRVITL